MRTGLILVALLAAGCASSGKVAKRDAEIERLRGELARAGERIEELELLRPGRPYEIVHVPPKIHGKVVAVYAGENVVDVSIGREDLMAVGFELTVYRGNEYVAKLVIDRVEEETSRGHSDKSMEKSPIRVGDEVTTSF